jgi:hypothetical protein
LLPLAASARDVGQRFSNPAAIRQEWTCLLEITHRGGVILQIGLVVITFGYQSLAEIGLESKGGLGGLPRLFPERFRGLKGNSDIADRIDVLALVRNC